MVMPHVTLELASISKLEDLPTCSPNLLPFSVNYTGPAPISTYFRVERTSSQVAVPPLDENFASLESEKAVESIASSSKVNSSDVIADPKHDDADGVAETPADVLDSKMGPTPVETISSPGLPTDAPARFVASFRGRIVQGMSVGLPEGYAGIVLKADGTGATVDAKGKGKEKVAKAKVAEKETKGRVTRSSRAKATEDLEMEVDEDIVMDSDSGHEREFDPRTTRILHPVSTFSSFVLWHPDIPVDEGRDEYLRSLNEWTRLSAEIHQVDEC